MKQLNRMLALGFAAAMGFTACEKVPNLPFYGNGSPVELKSNTSSVAAQPGDSSKVVLSFTWSNPNYATNEASNKYILQLDSAGRNFSQAISREVIGNREYSFTAKDLNNILLGWGFEFGRQYSLEARLISSYGNNNERLTSNTLPLRATPYKIPPKVVLPNTGKLFIVGDATEGGWGNPVPVPTQELTRLDETTFAGVFNLFGGGSYLIIPENGQWRKYSVTTGAATWQGGDFGSELPSNIPGPPVDGLYKITLDFQRGKFTVEPFTQQHGLPQALVVVGGATLGGWANEAGNPQKFTRRNATQWDITIPLDSDGEYLILPEPGNWGKKYGVADNSIEAAKLGGTLVPEGKNLKSPNDSANYKIVVDFANNSYKLTKQ
jgi:hypothetical protein